MRFDQNNLNSIRSNVHTNKNDNSSNSTSIVDGNRENYNRSIEKSYSLLDDPLADFIGQGMIEPIPIELEDDDVEGDSLQYDSDPEVSNYYSTKTSFSSLASVPPNNPSPISPNSILPPDAMLYSNQQHDDEADEIEMKQSVQVCFIFIYSI